MSRGSGFVQLIDESFPIRSGKATTEDRYTEMAAPTVLEPLESP